MIFHKSVLVSGSTAGGNAVYYKEGSCDSTEEKPTGADAAGISEGSVLVETDTGDVYFYNTVSNSWIKQFSLQG